MAKSNGALGHGESYGSEPPVPKAFWSATAKLSLSNPLPKMTPAAADSL
jgi:hypothetical protein